MRPAAPARSCPFPFLTGKNTLQGEGGPKHQLQSTNLLPNLSSPPPLGPPPPPPQAQRGRPDRPESLQEARNVGSKAFYSCVLFFSFFFFLKRGKTGWWAVWHAHNLPSYFDKKQMHFDF